MPLSYEISVCARDSSLSKKQVEEVFEEIKAFYPDIQFHTFFTKSYGDLNKTQSLRTLEKSDDFFTRELDELVLNGTCRIAIHSAKDLPEPLKSGLCIAALTKGIDPSDVLVLREGEQLKKGALIATSSERREEAVSALFRDVHFIDIRGTIEERLKILQAGKADGVVIAEAALIRLGLTHLNRIRLNSPTAALQGRLAIVVKEGDQEMLSIFSKIHDETPSLSGIGS